MKKEKKINVYEKSLQLSNHLVEFNNRFFYFSIQKLEYCLFSRRNGHRGKILFGHSIFFYLKNKKNK